MQPMCLCFFWFRQFEETFENAHWRKVKQMQPMWLCILIRKQFEDTFENTQRWKAKQMQPMWLCLISGKQFEKTFDDTPLKECEESFENAQWRKPNKCNQWCFTSSLAIYDTYINMKTQGYPLWKNLFRIKIHTPEIIGASNLLTPQHLTVTWSCSIHQF